MTGEPGWWVLHQSRASGRLLNFMGAMSGPVTMKSPLTTRMVSVVLALPHDLPRQKFRERIGTIGILRALQLNAPAYF